MAQQKTWTASVNDYQSWKEMRQAESTENGIYIDVNNWVVHEWLSPEIT